MAKVAGFILLLKKCVLIITFRARVHKRWVRTYSGIRYNTIFITTIIIIIMVIIIIINIITIIIIIIVWGKKRERVLTPKRRNQK